MTVIAKEVLQAKSRELKVSVETIDAFISFLKERAANMRMRQETYLEELAGIELALEKLLSE